MVFSFYILVAGCSQKIQQENILAEFDGQVVTVDELEKEISELSEYKQSRYKDQAGREEYLTLMAESRMLLKVAVEKGLDKDIEIVKQTKDYKDQLIVKELVKREVDDRITIADVDLKKYYAEHEDEFLEPEKLVVTEITLKEEEKAKEIMEEIKGGTDFTELAKEMDAKGESSGPGSGNEGKTRPFSRESFSSAKEFVETAYSLEIGQISDIIVQPMGEGEGAITYYMIVRPEERIPARQKEFSEVEKKIRRTVEKEKKKERMDQWLGTLKTGHNFQLYPEKLPETLEEKAEEAAESAEKAEESMEKAEESVEKTGETVEAEAEEKASETTTEEEKAEEKEGESQ